MTVRRFWIGETNPPARSVQPSSPPCMEGTLISNLLPFVVSIWEIICPKNERKRSPTLTSPVFLLFSAHCLSVRPLVLLLVANGPAERPATTINVKGGGGKGNKDPFSSLSVVRHQPCQRPSVASRRTIETVAHFMTSSSSSFSLLETADNSPRAPSSPYSSELTKACRRGGWRTISLFEWLQGRAARVWR